jgi:hydrogenase-4 component B
MVQREKRAKHIAELVEDSFSFGLMLVCIGLCLTLFYLLFVLYRM